MAVSLRKSQSTTDWHLQLDRLEKFPTVPGSRMDRVRSEQIGYLRRRLREGQG